MKVNIRVPPKSPIASLVAKELTQMAIQLERRLPRLLGYLDRVDGAWEAYKRATWLQAPLAVVSFICRAAVWLHGGRWGRLVAAAFICAVVPFTFLVIMPSNQRLLAHDRDLSSAGTSERMLLSLVSTTAYLWLILRR